MIAEIEKILRNHPNEIIFGYLFGSHAKGLARASSDIDLGLFANPESEQTFFDIKMNDHGSLMEKILQKIGRLNEWSSSLSAAWLSPSRPRISNRWRIF